MTEATRSEGTTSTAGSPHGQGDDALEKRVAEGPRGGARTWYDVLEVAPDVSAADLKKAYDRALSLVEGRSIGGYLMLDPLAAESARADVEAAFSVLGDADRRRAYDAKLRDSGEEPVTRRGDARDSKVDASRADEDARHARELLAIEAAQEARPASSSTSSVPASSLTSSPGLKFTAPAEPSEEAPVSPGRPSTPPGAHAKNPSSAPVRVDAPVATDPFEPVHTRRLFLQEPVEEVLQATATIPPEAAMPSPSGSASAGAGAGTGTTGTSAGTGAAAPSALALPDAGEIPGALIRQLREARGLTLDDLAAATKIRKPYLRAIEDEDVPNLPARVYLRGFLTQMARLLKVDRARLADGYLLTAERLSRGAPPSTS